jgi:hypothetical protein
VRGGGGASYDEGARWCWLPVKGSRWWGRWMQGAIDGERTVQFVKGGEKAGCRIDCFNFLRIPHGLLVVLASISIQFIGF